MSLCIPGRSAACWIIAFAAGPWASGGMATEWTLEASVARAVEVAPELETAQAAVRAQFGAVRQSGAWPNPGIEVRADDRLARELGGGGRDVTMIAITQPLPVGRGARRMVAARELASLENAADAGRLELEWRVASAYHRLQREQALYALAGEALEEARHLAAAESRRFSLGEVSRREALRLEVLAAQAEVTLAEAEGEWSEARYAFASILALDPDGISLPALPPPPGVPDLAMLEEALSSHPALAQARARLDMVEAEQAQVRAERLPALSVTVFRERDVIAGRAEPISGASLSLQLPLWDRRLGRRDELAGRAIAERARATALQRELALAVSASHQHLEHLIEQTRRQESAVLVPAREIHALTRRGYEAGEIDLTALIDALRTKVDAEVQQQTLRAQALLTLAELHHAAGVHVGADHTTLHAPIHAIGANPRTEDSP